MKSFFPLGIVLFIILLLSVGYTWAYLDKQFPEKEKEKMTLALKAVLNGMTSLIAIFCLIFKSEFLEFYAVIAVVVLAFIETVISGTAYLKLNRQSKKTDVEKQKAVNSCKIEIDPSCTKVIRKEDNINYNKK